MCWPKQTSKDLYLHCCTVSSKDIAAISNVMIRNPNPAGPPPPRQNERTTFGCKCACALPYLPRPVSFGAISKLNSTPCWCSILGPTTTLPKELPDFSAHKTALELWFTPFSGPKLRRKCTTRKEKEGPTKAGEGGGWKHKCTFPYYISLCLND